MAHLKAAGAKNDPMSETFKPMTAAEVADCLEAWADRPCAGARPNPAAARALARRVREAEAAGRLDSVLAIDAAREVVNRMTDAEWAEYDAATAGLPDAGVARGLRAGRPPGEDRLPQHKRRLRSTLLGKRASAPGPH